VHQQAFDNVVRQKHYEALRMQQEQQVTQNKVKAWEDQAKKRDQRIAELSADLDRYKRSFAAQENDLVARNAEVARLLEVQTALQQRVMEMETSLTSAECSADKSHDCAALQHQIACLEQDLQEKRQLIQSMGQQLENKTQTLLSVGNKVQEKIGELTCEVGIKASEAAKARGECAKLEDTVKKQIALLSKEQQRVLMLRKENEVLKQQVSNAQSPDTEHLLVQIRELEQCRNDRGPAPLELKLEQQASLLRNKDMEIHRLRAEKEWLLCQVKDLCTHPQSLGLETTPGLRRTASSSSGITVAAAAAGLAQSASNYHSHNHSNASVSSSESKAFPPWKPPGVVWSRVPKSPISAEQY
jgi:chromosome segregation ATPase